MGRTKKQISYNMSRVRSKDSVIELLLRRELWRRGLRYRLHCKDIEGKPDIVFRRQKVAVFVDSEFWHGYKWSEERKFEFKTNREFWVNKIERNIQRDKEVNSLLKQDGWLVLRFWGHEIKNDCEGCADIVEDALKTRR